MLYGALCLTPLLLAGGDGPGDGDPWPGWRGPGGSGVASGSPPLQWSEEENVRWKVEVPGRGLSCPVVWGEHVFLTTAVPTGKQSRAAAK